MRKLILLFAISVMLANVSWSQNDTHYSLFMFNKLVQNSAYAGSKEALNVTGHYRNQWAGIDGAPKTFTLSGHTSFLDKRCGVGLTLVSDNIGIMNTLQATLSYAYRIKFQDKGTLSVGVQGQLEHGRTDWSKSDPLDQDDDMIPMNPVSKVNPNFGMGIYYAHEKFYAGLSIPRVFQTTVYDDEPIGGENIKTWRSYYFMAGGIFRISKNVKFQPGTLVTISPNSPFELDINANFVFMDKIWFGGSFRLGDSFNMVLQYQFTPKLKLAIGTDLTLTELRKFSAGTFEIMVDYSLEYRGAKLNNIRFF